MANQKVYKTETISLLDDTEITLRPLSLKGIKGFHDQFDGALGEGKFTDHVTDLAQFCLKDLKVEWADDKEVVEDKLDLDSALFILEICAGVKFADPNLLNTVQVLEQMASDGTI